MTAKDAKERAGAGAKFLDKKTPGWALKVSVPDLNMRDGLMCVVGQIYDGYAYGTRMLNVGVERQRKFGFVLSDDDALEVSCWTVLGNAWKREIKTRTKRGMTA